jgi:hypothetical protein
MTLSPMVTPLRITVLAPIQQFAPILTGATVKSIFSM